MMRCCSPRYPLGTRGSGTTRPAHDLRHTRAVLAGQTGATLAELMARLGHSTPGAAMRYQHAAPDRDKAIAEALSRTCPWLRANHDASGWCEVSAAAASAAGSGPMRQARPMRQPL